MDAVLAELMAAADEERAAELASQCSGLIAGSKGATALLTMAIMLRMELHEEPLSMAAQVMAAINEIVLARN
jgi:hypothetical protein